MRPLITLLVCVTLTALGQQQDVFGSVAGRVFDAASNQPIAEATVFLIGLTKAGTPGGQARQRRRPSPHGQVLRRRDVPVFTRASRELWRQSHPRSHGWRTLCD